MIQLRPIRQLGTAAAALVVAAAVLPGQSQAAVGATKLVLNGPAANALREQGVRFAPLKPAKGGQQRVSLPVAAGLAGSTTSLLRHRGGLMLRAGQDKVRLRQLTVLLSNRSRVSASLDGREIVLFRILPGGIRRINTAGGAVRLEGLRLKLTGRGARALAAGLGLERIRPKLFATLATEAAKLTPGSAPSGAGPAPGGGSGGGAAQSGACPLPSRAGPDAPAVVPPWIKPPGALDIASASVAWRVRESFIRYIATGNGTSASGGASADPPESLAGAPPLSYGFRFPGGAEGWLHPGANPADPVDDRASVRFAGAVRFRYDSHGIDIETASPEIQIDGANSRAVFAISENGAPAQRQVLVNLDLSRAAAVRQTGTSYTYEKVPGAVPGGTASSVFGGFYTPGTDFGCFSVSFSTS